MERSFLDRLGAGRQPIESAAALVVAHPDDETLAAGAQLSRLENITIVHVTDGAPRNGADAARHGFATAAEYAAARRRELECAVGLAGVTPDALVGFAIADQEAALRMPEVARQLAALLVERRIGIVLTHAYEGGHPDHDAVALCVHEARRLLAAEGRAVDVIEMPFYHADASGWVRQRFVPNPRLPETRIRLAEAEMALKRRMLDAHTSQRGTLAGFGTEEERFRPAPAYDFTALPNGGDLLYERYGWGMTGARWRQLARDALDELRARPCA